MMSTELHLRCTNLIHRLGLGSDADIRSVTPLAGGVASDIAAVDLGDRTICAKFALEKLRVAEDWLAPIERNAAEYAWLESAGQAVPGVAPKLYGRDIEANGFAMEFIQGDDIYLWKTALLDGKPVNGEAAKVGDVLGRIHKRSAAAEFDVSPFQNAADFYDLRLEPYLAFTAGVHPDLAAALGRLVNSLQANSTVLVHGDVSPKNILFRDGSPVMLDAECASMGDPSFDVAFCLNHLILKSFHMPERADSLVSEVRSLWSAYKKHVDWEETGDLDGRVAELLPALMLARVDGKSPVEYLDSSAQERVRQYAIEWIRTPPTSIDEIVTAAGVATKGNRS